MPFIVSHNLDIFAVCRTVILKNYVKFPLSTSHRPQRPASVAYVFCWLWGWGRESRKRIYRVVLDVDMRGVNGVTNRDPVVSCSQGGG